MELVPYRELTTWRLGEVGTPVAYVRDARVVAIVSRFPLLSWEGRAVYYGHHPSYRVTLYDPTLARRIAVFDEARYPVNDIAVHPREPIVAIASGEYDGGSHYEGALLVWNHETGAWRSLLDDSRDVRRVRWAPDGRLVIVCSPLTDEEEAGKHYGAILDPRETFATARLAEVDHRTFGFAADDADAPRAGDELGMPARSIIWDLAWTPEGLLAAAHDDGHVDLWSTATGTLERTVRVPGRAVQLLRQPARLLVHAIDRGSTIVDLELREVATFSSPRNCSIDATGRILARDTQSRRDRILAPNGRVVLDEDLGHYDAFNHALRVDGDARLWFLRGEPAHQHLHKVLCSIDASCTIRVEAPWDAPGDGPHLMVGSACIVDGDDLVRAYVVYDPKSRGERVIERHDRWRHVVGAATIALVAWPAVGAVVAALVDGTSCILDAESGAVLHEERHAIDGIPTIPTALAVHDETIAIGTIDGRISLFSAR